MSSGTEFHKNEDLDISGVFESSNYNFIWLESFISLPIEKVLETDEHTEWKIEIYNEKRDDGNGYYVSLSAELLRSAREPLAAQIEAQILSNGTTPELKTDVTYNFITDPGRCRPFFNEIVEDQLRKDYVISGNLIIAVKVQVSSFSVLDDNFKLSPLFKDENTFSGGLIKDLDHFLTQTHPHDLVIISKEREFKAHKFLLTLRSEVFRKMFSNDMKETRDGRVEIEDIEPEVVEEMLNYMYTDKVKFEEQGELMKLIQAADKYQLNHLKSVCQSKLLKTLSVKSSVELLMFSDKYDLQMKKYVIMYIAAHAEEIVETEDWKRVVGENGALVGEVLKKILHRIPEVLRSASSA